MPDEHRLTARAPTEASVPPPAPRCSRRPPATPSGRWLASGAWPDPATRPPQEPAALPRRIPPLPAELDQTCRAILLEAVSIRYLPKLGREGRSVKRPW